MWKETKNNKSRLCTGTAEERTAEMTENKKYELTNEIKEWWGHTLHRIKALKDFGAVKAGELGGWVESEYNLLQDGDCWIYDEASVYDSARVGWDAIVRGNATVCDEASVCDNAAVYDNARVYGYATVCDNARVCDNATVCGYATVCDSARVGGDAIVRMDTDYIVVQGFGRVQRTTTFYRLKDGDIGVSCGCFHGTIKQFRDKVKKTHGDGKYAKEYLMIADLMELHFGEENKS